MIKSQHEKRLQLREQFELEHEDASMDCVEEQNQEEDIMS
jgi:hypothetical protein